MKLHVRRLPPLYITSPSFLKGLRLNVSQRIYTTNVDLVQLDACGFDPLTICTTINTLEVISNLPYIPISMHVLWRQFVTYVWLVVLQSSIERWQQHVGRAMCLAPTEIVAMHGQMWNIGCAYKLHINVEYVGEQGSKGAPIRHSFCWSALGALLFCFIKI